MTLVPPTSPSELLGLFGCSGTVESRAKVLSLQVRGPGGAVESRARVLSLQVQGPLEQPLRLRVQRGI